MLTKRAGETPPDGGWESWSFTLRRPLFPEDGDLWVLRILRPPLTELPREFREAAAASGCRLGRFGDRPGIEGDRRSLLELSQDPRLPSGFLRRLVRLLHGPRSRKFEMALPRGRSLVLGDPPALFGVINVTPDSFSDGGRYLDPGRALEGALEMVREGVDVIDVGGESSRPGARPIDLDEERRRVEPVIRGIRGALDTPVSIDTVKAEIARMALAEGADIINDVSAMRDDPAMAAVARDSGAPVVLVHRRGTSKDMQDHPRYDDVTREVYEFLEQRIRDLRAEGLEPERVIVDPGIGFGKRVVDNLRLLRDVDELGSLGRPVMIGASRKSFLGKLLGGSPPEARQVGTLAVHAVAILAGAAAIRVHDVPGHRDLIRMIRAVARPEAAGGE